MRIGVLLCDEFRPEYVAMHGDYPSMLTGLMPKVNHKVYFAFKNDLPRTAQECDAWMISGSRSSVYEFTPWILNLMKLVRQIHEHRIPCLGICFGHQLIAESLGGKVEKAPNGWCVGIHKYDVTLKKDWMSPISQNLNLLMMCQDQVSRLPEEASLLAKSEESPVAMYSIGEHILALQGHPEFTKGYVRSLIEDRSDRISPEKSKKAIQSLNGDHDNHLFKEWVKLYFSS